jgi:hypothetical protein
MISKEELQNSLECINESFDITLKANDLRDRGLLDRGDDIINQSAKLGELMWRHLWDQVANGSPTNSIVDRGDQVKKHSSSHQGVP